MKYEIIKQEVDEIIFTEIKISNNQNFEVTFLDYGASIFNIRYGHEKDTMMSMTAHPLKLKEFINSKSYFGKTITRYAGRIENGCFNLNNNNYFLEQNEFTNTLHGTTKSAAFRFWDYEVVTKKEYIQVIFQIMILDKEDGFPGNQSVNVIYTIKENEDTLYIDYFASSDRDTLCNITNHTYFNLNGNVQENILNHKLQIKASLFSEVDEEMIPTNIKKVTEVPCMNFLNKHLIGDFIEDEYLQKHRLNGYDTSYLFDYVSSDKINVTLFSPLSKIGLNVKSSYPVIVVYTSNYVDNVLFRNFRNMKKYDGITLECQYFPNAINMKSYEKAKDSEKSILRCGEVYHESIEYQFYCKQE